jgi:hypothetical protein
MQLSENSQSAAGLHLSPKAKLIATLKLLRGSNSDANSLQRLLVLTSLRAVSEAPTGESWFHRRYPQVLGLYLKRPLVQVCL